MSLNTPFLSRGLQESIDKTEIKDGKILFAIDSARLFIDTKNDRVEISDFVKGLTYSEILALKSPLPKLYLSSDSHQLLLYDFKEEEWIVYTGGIAPERAIVNIYFNENADMVLVYGDGHESTVNNNTMLNKVNETEQTVNNIQNDMNTIMSAIEIQK